MRHQRPQPRRRVRPGRGAADASRPLLRRRVARAARRPLRRHDRSGQGRRRSRASRTPTRRTPTPPIAPRTRHSRPWSAHEPARARATCCARPPRSCASNAEALALLDAMNTGNPVGADGRRCADRRRPASTTSPDSSPRSRATPSRWAQGLFNYTVREPLGVVARIVAYNHPLMFAAVKIGAPLAAGNTVVVKPPEQAPLSSLQDGGAHRRRLSARRAERPGRRQGVRPGAVARIRWCARSR